MTCNGGGMDKTIRLLIGAAALVVGLLAPLDMVWKVVLFVVAAIALLTASVGYCPLNALLGINSCQTRGRE